MDIFLLLLIGVFLLWFFVFRKMKKINLGAVTTVVGGVKSGKSAVSVHLAIRQYRRNHFSWRVKRFFCKLFRRSLPEEPLLYSNIPLAKYPYVPLTTDVLLRKKRIRYKSVILMDEASLIADSMLIKDQKTSAELLLFCKLIGHESRGGNLIINSHCISDLHFAMKRTTSTYYYINDLRKFPFICVSHCREERYSDDGSTINVYNEDVSETMLNIWFPKSVFKLYDCYAFSVLTDSLRVSSDVVRHSKKDSLKVTEICSFRDVFQALNNELKQKGGDK